MVAEIPARDDTELERLFAQARRYDLLSREQEQEIDQRKWRAVGLMLSLLLDDPFSRHYLMRMINACSLPLPEIEQFTHRRHRLLLRRELTEHLPGGSQSRKVKRLLKQFAAPYCGDALLERLTDLSLPASLVVGISEVVMQQTGDSKVAEALHAWERHWPREYADVSSVSRDTAGALQQQISAYLSARDQLITHNLRLVYTIVGRNSNKGVPFLDLVQEGNLGLLRAAEKFEFERGYRFSTYAFNWITQGVKRSLASAAGTIRYPNHVQMQLGEVHGERNRILARSGRTPSDTELAESLDLSVDKTRELLQLRNFGVSLDTPRFDDETGSTLLDTLSDGPFGQPGDDAEQASLHDRLLEEISRLNKIEQQVVTLRWGLLQGSPLTRTEVADQLAVSKEWVRQLEMSALKKLQRSEVMQAVYRDHSNGVKAVGFGER